MQSHGQTAQDFACFLYLSPHMKLTAALYKQKMTHSGVGVKKLSKDLAVTS